MTKGNPGVATASRGATKLPAGTLVLSTGITAVVRDAKGRDLEKGAAVARDATNPMSLMMGVASIVTTLDGKAITYEDLLELPMVDVMSLIGEIGGNVPVPSQLSGISS